MLTNTTKNVWFVTGSQHLYGPKVLATVAEDSQTMVKELNDTAGLNINLVWQPTVKTPEEIYNLCQAANADENCVGLVLWMHTFSPAKMWIGGLNILNKPWLHLHTQFNAALPWADIDMNYMNLHQSAHGDREFGHIGTRMRIERKVVAGYWRNKDVQKQMDDWCRAASGWHESRHLKVARFGDNMRQVAVTDGDKVAAQIQFGYEVNAYGVQDLVDVINQVSASDVKNQLDLYKNDYVISAETLSDSYKYQMLENEARLELGILKFLNDGKYKAFTNCFENLAGMTGLPGLATQRLMSQGFGYGGEGDWKTSAMVRIMKVMGEGKKGGTSFMEDYTYNFGGVDQVLGAHMLEVCPSISGAKPRLEVHRHTIGVKCDVARLLFTAAAGPSINVSPIDLGTRFRIIVNEANTVTPPADLPNLPVGGALWEPKPNLSIASAAWIHAGGAHHAAYSQSVTTEVITDYAEMAGVEAVVIDADTTIRSFKNELRQSAAYYHLNRGL